MSLQELLYSEATAFLFSKLPNYQKVGAIAYKPGLHTAQAFDEYFGFPHRQYKTIHVAGTNGKGSVSHILASVLQSAGYKVGLFTSPHLKDFRERIKVNGAMIAEAEVVDFVLTHKSKIEELQSSFFEMTATLALSYFASQAVDIAIIEVGMGGRLDATNVIQPILSIITNIGMDHTEHLGDSLAAIAAEKAGIIKAETPMLIGERQNETSAVFEAKAKALNAPLRYADNYAKVDTVQLSDNSQSFTITLFDSLFTLNLQLGLQGSYQRKNIVTVLAALDILKNCMDNNQKPFDIEERALQQGLAKVVSQTGLRGRWEILAQQPLIICDTGHNADGLKESMAQLQSLPRRRLHFVLGMVKEKNLDSVLPLLPADAYYYFTQADLPRALDAHELAKRCGEYSLRGQITQTVSNALKIAKSNACPDDIIFIGGSTYVVAEAIE
ncbi:MAG: bifunctional folylpolyglutamate synthase/dihydrofolate synthase [Bacteroidales bacterium]|nr:bifunctional folylpolyglutamate synthase/dihydrofolate synthase [Bacteroidales bacterium]MCL2133698.1 bifunctional folylpolyglutamate synthase/dihydrofolate synthase [Bacteroidales bacterium]